MKQVAIIQTGAAGDVVRSTTSLHLFTNWQVTWFVSPKNAELLPTQLPNLTIVPISIAGNEIMISDFITEKLVYHYQLVINLEDDYRLAQFATQLSADEFCGVYVNPQGTLTYTESSNCWNDLGLLSRFGIDRANELKLANRQPVQALWYQMLGAEFTGQPYILNKSFYSNKQTIKDKKINDKEEINTEPNLSFTFSPLSVVIETRTAPRWPSKMWHGYEQLANELKEAGHTVKILGQCPTITEYAQQIAQADLLIGGDSLSMHLALGLGVPHITIYTASHPYEIYNYNQLQTQVISPVWEKYFYGTEYCKEAVEAIKIDDIISILNITQFNDKIFLAENAGY